MMGFQAWLGAKVVYSVLNPIKITVHMVMALVIVAFILYIIQLARPKVATVKYNSTFRNVLLFSLLLTLIQVAIGTQVRQFVDEQVKNGLTASILWLQNPSITFYVHRSFSILVFLVNVYLYIKNTKFGLGYSKINWVLALIGVEILTGMAMAYLDFPIGSQAIHLVLASILFGIQFYMILEAKKPNPAKS
ncbi:Heme A synthase [compost metagenome]